MVREGLDLRASGGARIRLVATACRHKFQRPMGLRQAVPPQGAFLARRPRSRAVCVLKDWVVAENRGYSASREAMGAGWAGYAARLKSRESVMRTKSVGRQAVKLSGLWCR